MPWQKSSGRTSTTEYKKITPVHSNPVQLTKTPENQANQLHSSRPVHLRYRDGAKGNDGLVRETNEHHHHRSNKDMHALGVRCSAKGMYHPTHCEHTLNLPPLMKSCQRNYTCTSRWTWSPFGAGTCTWGAVADWTTMPDGLRPSHRAVGSLPGLSGLLCLHKSSGLLGHWADWILSLPQGGCLHGQLPVHSTASHKPRESNHGL